MAGDVAHGRGGRWSDFVWQNETIENEAKSARRRQNADQAKHASKKQGPGEISGAATNSGPYFS